MQKLLAVLRSTPVKVAFLVVAVAAAIWAIVAEWPTVSATVREMNVWFLVGGLALGIVYIMLTMLAWRAIINELGPSVPLKNAATIFLVSQLGKYLPGGVWNILAAAELGVAHAITRRRSVSAMAVSILISIVSGLLLAVASVPLAPAALADRYGWALWTLPVFVILLLPPVLNRLLDLALKVTRREPMESRLTWTGIVVPTLWSLAAWIVAGLQVWLLGVGVGMEPTAATVMLCIGGYALAWTVGFLVVFVPAGAGVREVVLGLVLGASLGAGTVIVVVLLSRFVLTIADLGLGGAAMLVARKTKKPGAEQGAADPAGPSASA